MTITVLANDTDPENDTLTVTVRDAPLHGRVRVQADKTLLYTPRSDFNGKDIFTYTASDGRLTNQATVTITVSPVNDQPKFSTPTVQRQVPDGAQPGTPVGSPVTANDIDGEPLRYGLFESDAQFFTIDTRHRPNQSRARHHHRPINPNPLPNANRSHRPPQAPESEPSSTSPSPQPEAEAAAAAAAVTSKPKTTTAAVTSKPKTTTATATPQPKTTTATATPQPKTTTATATPQPKSTTATATPQPKTRTETEETTAPQLETVRRWLGWR